MKKKYFAMMLLFSLTSFNISFAAPNFSYQEQALQNNSNQYVQQPLQYPNNMPLQGNVVMVPAGTQIPAILYSHLSSSNAKVGQSVNLILNSDFYYNNKIIAPAGSTVVGSIIEASKAKRGSMNGKLCVRFNQIYTPYGAQIPISAVIKTDDNSGVLVGGTKMDVTKDYAKDVTAGCAVGALSGLVFGALSGGYTGRGAALGTAVGAGGGLVKSIWDKGNDVEIPNNSNIEILLTQPITVSASSYSYEN